MADHIVTAATDKEWRADLSLDATYQMDSLLDGLRQVNIESDAFRNLWRCIEPRLRELLSVSLSVYGGDDTRPTEEMADVVYGLGNWVVQEPA